MKLIVGLGNVGEEYKDTRHNIGFMCISHYVNKLNLEYKLDKNLECYIAKNKDTIFIKPITYMNLSGNSVVKVKNYYKVNEILVIHDDLDLEFSKIRIKQNGSSAGHNGLKSIISHIGENFIRLKIGIGRPINKDIVSYVLSRFSKEELDEIEELYETTDKILDEFVNNTDLRKLQNKYN